MHQFTFWFQSLGTLFGRYKQVYQVAWQNRSETDLKGYTQEEAEFLPAALALQEAPVPVLPRIILWVVITMGAIGLIWSIIGKIDIVATAQGKIVTSARSKIIQSLETIRVKAIEVHDGQSVKKGDILVALDDTDARANDTHTDQDLMAARLLAARSRAVLEAIQQHKSPVIPDIKEVDPILLTQERHLADSLYQEYLSRVNELRATEARRSAEQQTSRAAITRLEKSLSITEERAADYKKLVDSDYISRHEFLAREQQQIEQSGDLSIQERHVHELSAAMLETQRQREALTAEMIRSLNSSLSEAEQKIATLTSDREKTAARLQDMNLISPVDGVVQQLAIHTLGEVVTPAQPLMVIVPTEAPVEIEATIENRDIGFVHAGQDAEIKVEAFPYTKYGTLHGKVTNVSADAVADEKKGLIYIAHIHLDKTTMNVGDKIVSLTPGMVINAEIKTGRRRLIEYFLAPFVEYQKDSLRER